MTLVVLANCRRVILCLSFLLWLVSVSVAQEEEAVFSNDDPVTAADTLTHTPSPSHPATTYWRVVAVMNLTTAAPGTRVQMLLPLSDGRQSVLARRTDVEGVRYREETDGLNLWGHWFVTEAGETPQQITYEYTVQIADSHSDFPTVPFPVTAPAASFAQYLTPSALIQSDAPAVRERAEQLARGKPYVDQVVQALYQHVAAFGAPDAGTETNDALAVLAAERGSRGGKTRALVALLRAAGIPARVVGGIRLGDTARKRTTISWAEALIGETWVPLDPTEGYFAWLPNSYLALYRDDLPLLTHTRHVAVEYTFFIRQLTRSAALSAGQSALSPPHVGREGLRYESEYLRTVAVYVDRPRANVVLINDGTIPQAAVKRILAEAQQSQLNVAVLGIDSDLHTFREHYLQSLVSHNLALLREANLLLINTADTAGFSALLKQGEVGLTLRELRVVVASEVGQPIGKVLAAVLLRLLEPNEIVLTPYESDVVELWEIARSSVLSGSPLLEEATRRVAHAALVNSETMHQLGWWRQWVVTLWASAVRAQVSLPALNLILVLPLIAFFLVIIRNVIGLETFGTFSPMLLALAFLTTRLAWGLGIFALIVGVGTGLRLLLQHLRLHLVSRVAILIAVVSISMAALTVLGALFGFGGLLHVSIFPMVIMANMIESFTNTQLERGTGEALRLTLSTLLVATCSYVGIENTGLKPFVLVYPEILVAVIGIEVVLGRWRGLRLMEYVRFYNVIRQPEAEPAAETRKMSVG